jgi:hypothetical protein
MNDFYRMIRAKVEEYATLEENKTEDGSVNWDFVDADICMDLNMTDRCLQDYYLPLFNKAVDNYVAGKAY